MNHHYEDSLMKLEGVAGPHTISDIDIYMGSGILENAPAYIRKRDLGSSCLLIADDNTMKAAGAALEAALGAHGFTVRRCVLAHAARIEADERSSGDVLMACEPEPDFLIACGSGVINDVTRFIAHSIGKPFVSVGTAASMDGYISVIAPMIYRNKKVHRHGSAPRVLVLDTRILRAAPYEMIVAGFGDVLGKYIAKADWLLSRIVNGEAVDENAVGLITQALENLVSHVDDIKNLTEKGLAAVIEGLILAGITIFTIGHTRAVASVEHNQGHIWETRMLESGRPYALHGISVGCSTGYYLRMYDYFRGLDIRALDRDAARSAILDYEKIRQDALSCFGEEFLAVIEAENPVFRVTRSEFERQYDALTTNWERILRTLSFLPGWDDYRRLYAKLAYPIDAEAIGIPPELLTYTLRYAHLYRDRYSVVDALHILGAAHMAADGTLADYRKLRDGDSCAGNGSDGLL